jgi:hypothetical protein
MRYLHPFLFYVLICLSLSSCNKNQDAEEKKTPVSVAPGQNDFTVKAAFTCEELKGADEPDPESVLYLLHSETQHTIDTISTCSIIAREMYTTYNIPLNALSAAGGWWAGRGNFYYAIQEGDSLAVMHASPLQQQDSAGYEYKIQSRFPIIYLDE